MRKGKFDIKAMAMGAASAGAGAFVANKANDFIPAGVPAIAVSLAKIAAGSFLATQKGKSAEYTSPAGWNIAGNGVLGLVNNLLAPAGSQVALGATGYPRLPTSYLGNVTPERSVLAGAERTPGVVLD